MVLEDKSGRCVANVGQVCGRQVCGSWSFQCGNMPGLSVREGGRCVAVGRFSVAVVPRLCVSQCGRCVVSAWQLSVSRQVCLTIGLMKIMVEKPPKLFRCFVALEGRKGGVL